MSRIVIVGAGKIGQYIARLLNTDKSNVLVVSDKNRLFDHRTELHEPNSENEAFQTDIFTSLAMADVLKGADYLINAAPVYDPNLVGKLVMECILRGIHYLDISEDIHVGAEVRKLGTIQNRVMVAPHCGLAPGMISILAGSLSRRFNFCNLIDMRVGALPLSVGNDIGYVSNWSVDGLVNEYLNDAYLIDQAHTKKVNVFFSDDDCADYVAPVIIEGVTYESFPTSGGVGTMLELGKDAIYNYLGYRTIRYQGHLAEMRRIVESHAGDRLAILKHMQKYVADTTTADVVLMFCRVAGVNSAAQYREINVGFRITGEEWPAYQTAGSAIQRTTARAVCAVLRLHQNPVEGSGVQRTGYVKQDQIDWNAFISTEYGNCIGATRV